MGALHYLAKIEEIDIEEYMDRKKRSGFTDRFLKTGEKLLDGSPGGFFVEMLKKSPNQSIIGSLELTMMM